MAQLVVAVAAVSEAKVVEVAVPVQALLVNVFWISDVVPLTVVCT